MTYIFYWTDLLFYIIITGIILLVIRLKSSETLKTSFKHILSYPRYWIALMIMTWFGAIGFLDSIHFKLTDQIEVKSLLDRVLSPRDTQYEKTYSAPFALTSYNKEVQMKANGELEEVTVPLAYAGFDLKNQDNKNLDILKRIFIGFGLGFLGTLLLFLLFRKKIQSLIPNTARKTFWITLFIILALTISLYALMFQYHILGTDKIGQDVFYIALKSIRTGLIIGTVTTLIVLPFAVFFGLWAGFFGGIVDDIIQYIYTTLSGVPAILLIAAAVLSFQTKMSDQPELRLLVLCIILGVTSWISLCRLIRAETLKLRESEFVQAAVILGAKSFSIINRHVLPNLLHIVVITTVLDFSGLVLAEAVLSFVRVGVDSETYSFGNMINASRLEMARDPIVWWSLFGAFILMFTLVFSANVVADGVERALNPRNI